MNLSELDLNLIPRVSATGGDANLQPTFGTLTGVVLPGTTASIALTASSTSVGVGSQFSVDVEIKTGSFTINEYRIVVDFDPTKLQVVDAEPNTPGTQVSFLDTVFQVSGGSNSTSAAGRITLIAKTPSGNALQVNRKVAKITFQAQNMGTSNVQTATGATGSQLINGNGVAIANTVNNLTINIGVQSSTSTATTNTTSRPSSSTTANTNTTTSSGGGGVIPDTALPDDIVAVLTVLIGLGLITLGVKLRRSRKDYDL